MHHCIIITCYKTISIAILCKNKVEVKVLEGFLKFSFYVTFMAPALQVLPSLSQVGVVFSINFCHFKAFLITKFLQYFLDLQLFEGQADISSQVLFQLKKGHFP